MKIYTCQDRLTDIMTCIYDAWSEALKVGHNQIGLKKEPIFQQTIFDEYIHVDGDPSKTEKVIRSIRRSISETAYMNIYYASLSADENALQAIYDFLRVGFAIGSTVVGQYTNPHVMNLLELRRQVSNEAHHFREFARFQSLENQVYVSHLEPRNDVIMLVGNHFANRMPSEHWMIIDDNRKTACVHVKDGENYLRYLTDDEFSVLQKTESYEDEYTDMWKTFFHAISIEQRKNYVCQRNLFPIWKRKHAVEFRYFKNALIDQFPPHKKTETTHSGLFSSYPISLHMEISPDNASKTWRFPFLNQNGLRTKEAACRTE